MTVEERRMYLQRTYDRAPEGSVRKLWAAAMLKQLEQKTASRANRKNTNDIIR